MPGTPDILERVTKLAAANNLALPPARSDVASASERTLDSIGLLELMIAVEQEFQISLMDEEFDAAERLKDMDALVDLIADKLGADSG